MQRARSVEIAALAVIAVLVLFGGHAVLVMLGEHKPWGWLIVAGLVFLAVRNVRSAYAPEDPMARLNVTKGSTYLCASILALWAVIIPIPPWILSSCLVATEVAIVLDIISLAAPGRAAGGK
jgi:hypothetical protein